MSAALHNLNWDFIFRGKRTERFLSELLIRHVRVNTVRHVTNSRMTCAATGKAGTLQINGIQAEIKFSENLKNIITIAYPLLNPKQLNEASNGRLKIKFL